MKIPKLLFVFFLPIILSCVKEKDIDYIIFSGIIEDPISENLRLLDKDYRLIRTINFSKSKLFNDTLNVSKGYYFIDDGKNTRQLYLAQGFKLKTLIKYNNSEISIIFEGKGGAENNYLQRKIQINKNFEKVENYKYFLSLNEQNFLKLADSINTMKTKFLMNQKNLNENFKFYESFSLIIWKTDFLRQYKLWKGEFIEDKDFQVSTQFPDPFDKVDLSNEKLLIHPEYLPYLERFIMDKSKINKIQGGVLLMLQNMDNEIRNQTIKDELAYRITIQGINETKMLDEVYSKYISINENAKYNVEIEKIYSKLKKTSKGSISPTFELVDINNKLISLESLKGKLVYIDIWATWCVPCIDEIPAFEELKKVFKNKDIYFVSICANDTKERFEQMVKEKEMKGIQLFASNINISFFNDYQLRTVPRYILIDNEGKIIDGNTYKPSSSKLKELIIEYL